MTEVFPHRADIAFSVRKQPAGGGRLCLSLAGELDISGVDLLEAWIDHVCGKGVRQVTLDLSGLAFIDVAGARGLAAACQRLRQHCGRVSVAGAVGQVQHVLDLYESIRTRPAAACPLDQPPGSHLRAGQFRSRSS
jgi:anti-sigma B factor antagonist